VTHFLQVNEGIGVAQLAQVLLLTLLPKQSGGCFLAAQVILNSHELPLQDTYVVVKSGIVVLVFG
jgi:hypothetical protein